MKDNLDKAIRLIRQRAIYIVIVPWVIYALYLTLIAAEEYESQSQVIIKSSDGNSAFDASSMLLSKVTTGGSGNDSEIIEAFIYSTDMLYYLDQKLALRAHFMSDKGDIFSRLSSSSSKEEFYSFYQQHIEVSVDAASSVITIRTRAYTPEFAQQVNDAIVEHAERFINDIGNNLAKSKLGYAKEEHQIVEDKLQQAKTDLLGFQSKYDVLDPTAEGAAAQQIAFSLQATLAQKQAEFNTMSTMMAETAPALQNIRRQIAALQEQVQSQKKQLSENAGKDEGPSVTELMAQFNNLQVQLQLAIQAYSSSLISLENARVEAYQQLQHLVIIETPTLPEENAYPRVIYNLALFGVVLLMIFGILRIVIATIREL